MYLVVRAGMAGSLGARMTVLYEDFMYSVVRAGKTGSLGARMTVLYE